MSETQTTPSFGTRLFALFGAVTVISFAAIIAGVPINLPRNQNGSVDFSDSGSNAWQIVATALILVLTPALAFAYGTLHGSNLNDLLRNVTVIGALVTFLWILFSFSLTYGKDAKGNGIMGYPITYYFFSDTQAKIAADPNDDNHGYPIANSIFAVYELGFAVITAVLVAISLADRVNLNSFIIFITIWHLIVYTPVAHILWTSRGALYSNWVEDFAGGLVVHVLSSSTSLALHLVLGKDDIPRAGPVANPQNALTYTFVVWFLWFGFNAGKAHNSFPVATQSVVNTIAATYVSVLMAYFYNTILDKPLTAVSMSNAVLIGLVAITPASGYVTVGGALVITVFTYVFTVVVSNFLLGEGNGVNESLSTLSIHSIAGTVGFIWTAILSYPFVNPQGQAGLTYGRGRTLGYQLAGLVAVWAVSFICNYILAWIVNLLSPLKSVQAMEADYKAPEQQAEGEVQVVESEQNKDV